MKVRIPSVLYSYTKGVLEVDAGGNTVDDVLHELNARYPGMRFRIIDETGRIRRHIMLFIGNRRVADLSERVDPNDELSIIPSISGGCRIPDAPPPSMLIELDMAHQKKFRDSLVTKFRQRALEGNDGFELV